MRATASYATMPISRAAYEEITAALEEAGYFHCLMDAEDAPIVMSGVGLLPKKDEEEEEPTSPAVFQTIFCKHCGRACLVVTESYLERGLCAKCDMALSDDGA